LRSLKKLTSSRHTIAIAALFVLLSILACQVDLGGPNPPGEPIATQAEAARTLTHMWQTAVIDAATTGRVFVLLNEMQLTSLLAQRMQASENPAMIDPQVFLRRNAIQIYGITERGPFKASLLFGVTPVIDVEGELSLDLTTAEFGPIPAPSAVKETVSAILTEAFTGTIGSLATGIRLTTIAISDGEMAIVGELR
jgi:hypothetical protein